jgi:putative transposase
MKKRNFSAEYKTKIAIEVLEGNMLAGEIASREDISPKQLSNWKHEFLKNAHRAFTTSKDEQVKAAELRAMDEREQELLAKIGQLTYERDWLKKKSKEVLGYEPTPKNGFK